MSAMKNTMRFKNASKVSEIEHQPRGWGKGYRVYLKDGYSFTYCECENMRGFDTMAKAKEALRDVYPCDCKQCRDGMERVAVKSARAAEIVDSEAK